VDLIGDARALSGAGKLPAADALHLVEVFHQDPERDVLARALDTAVWPHDNLVPPALIPNYQRFLRKNFQPRARELGWVPKIGEPDDVRLLRPDLVSAVAIYGGDETLAKQARELTGRWFEDRAAISPDVTASVLTTAAYYGDVALFRRFLAAFQKTEDHQQKQRLLGAMAAFRDPAAVQAGLQAVLSGAIRLVDGFPLLLGAGRESPQTRKMPFEFLQAHFDEIMKGHPSIFGVDLGTYLPNVGATFCDAQSRNELQTFFGPRVEQYPGAPRALARVLEGIDLCIAGKTAQEPGVAAFLKRY
jgi:cytosol alanyl aminopeptidase